MRVKLSALKVVKQTSNINQASVIVFHGSGDTGNAFHDWMKDLVGNFAMSRVKFLFPTAPLQPYTAFGGKKTYVWFDRYKIDPSVNELKESVDAMCMEISKLIDKEVTSGIPMENIIVGGFSMGGALALHVAYRFAPALAGVFALSSFLNDNSLVYEELTDNRQNARVPLFMCNGDDDTVVLKEWGENTFHNLQNLGVKGSFKILDNCMHEITQDEISELLDWIRSTLDQ